MSAKQRQGRGKLTANSERQGGRLRGVAKRRVDGTQLTTPSVTRKYKPRERKCARKGCLNRFTPTAKHGRFCCDACRQVEARRRAKKGAAVQKVERDLELTTCLYGGDHTFFRVAGSNGKYCCDSHKELAFRARKAATVNAIADSTGMSLEDAGALVLSAGMANCTRWLKQQGMAYNDSLRLWLVPMGVSVETEQG